jgi:DNA mismatch repair protein MutL
MNKINILGNEISDLIAAGEVVERPASVVKELVENSIDAGANKITVEIVGNGTEYIRVTDDGCGMLPEDARLAFQKHATSKISSKDDLYSIHTLGFRGEALAAISSVSKISMKTKEHESVAGYYVEIEGGTILSEGEAAASDGTSIIIRDLFYNTPARLKFIKSEQAERTAITALVEKLAISHTNIAFSYIINGAQRFYTLGNRQLENAVYSVFGQDLASDMISVDYDDAGISVSGLIGRPLATRPNRNFQVFFVNGRLVKSKILQQSFESAYRNSMLVGRYPVCAMMIIINSSEIDVNVHPSKLEIKFSNEKVVAQVISAAIREALSLDSGIYPIKFAQINNNDTSFSRLPEELHEQISTFKEVDDVRHVNNWEITTFKDSSKNNLNYSNAVQDYSSHKSFNRPDINNNLKLEMRSDPVEAISKIKEYVEKNNIDIDPAKISQYINNDIQEQQSTIDDIHKKQKNNEIDLTLLINESVHYKLIGEVFNTYIIVELSEEIMFIDKHALHERMIFEKLRSSNFIEVQTLLMPKLLFISDSDRITLLDNKELLKKIGFDLDDLDGTLIIREIPTIIEEEDAEVILTEIASDIKLKTYAGQELLDKFLYTISCKAAIKSGKRSSDFELKGLIDEYLNNRNSLKYCPHGRPIVFVLTQNAIEKQFKRIVG